MPRPLRSLRNRLTLIFALIVAMAIGIVYFYVAPRLEDQLVAQKLERLALEARARVGRGSRGRRHRRARSELERAHEHRGDALERRGDACCRSARRRSTQILRSPTPTRRRRRSSTSRASPSEAARRRQAR